MASNPFKDPGIFGDQSASSGSSRSATPQQRPAPLTTANNPFATTGGTDPMPPAGSANNPFTLTSSSPVGSSAGLPPTQPGVVGSPMWTDYTNYFLNENPGVAGAGYLNQQGINPYSNLGHFFNSAVPQLFDQYQMALTTNPGLNFTDFLTGAAANVRNAFASQEERMSGPIPPRRILG